MKLFIQSCHASLERDHARLFHDLGYDVNGDWDLGSTQRPKIPGITDHNESMEGCDVVILHQRPEYAAFMKDLLDKGKRVILTSFGQADTHQFQTIGRLCHDYPRAFVTPYSRKDTRRHLEFAPAHKIEMIRFGKYKSDFPEWIGDGGFAYISCNDIHHRGQGCGWEQYQELSRKVPIVLSGKRTEEVGGKGEITEQEMRDLMQHCACYVSFGTVPAPWVMTQMEAWMSGCPVIVLDNGCGITEEDLPIRIVTSIQEMADDVNQNIHYEPYRRNRHRESLEVAQAFDIEKIGQQWVKLLDRVMQS